MGHGPPKFLENIVILCFERRFSKQNSAIRLKSSILASPKFFDPHQIFGLATPLSESAGITPDLSKGGRGRWCVFHNSIIGNFIVYQDRIATAFSIQ